MNIRNVSKKDASRIAEIYNYYIENTFITFEIERVTTAEMRKRIANYSPWIVAEEKGKMIGYAYAGIFKEREAYKFTAELSIYFDKDYTGKGYGKRLLKSLIDRLKKAKYKVLIGIIALPNDASTRLLEKAGFKKVGHLEKVGYKFNKWIDVGYWELII